MLTNGLTSIVGNYIIKKDQSEINGLFNNMHFYIAFGVCFCCTSLLNMYQPFIKVWVGDNSLLTFSSVVLFTLYFFIVKIKNVGLLFKDKVEALFGDTLTTVGICLTVTAVLLVLSDFLPRLFSARIHGASGDLPVRPFTRTGREAQGASGDAPDAASAGQGTEAGCASDARNGISYWQAFVVGIGQALAVAPGLSRSGTTIATGLICGVKREVMAQFSFLMVLVPILGEQFLDLVKTASGEAVLGGGVSPVCLAAGFLAAFVSGLLACKVMIALVRKAKLSWFALYCLIVAVLIFIFA